MSLSADRYDIIVISLVAGDGGGIDLGDNILLSSPTSFSCGNLQRR